MQEVRARRQGAVFSWESPSIDLTLFPSGVSRWHKDLSNRTLQDNDGTVNYALRICNRSVAGRAGAWRPKPCLFWPGRCGAGTSACQPHSPKNRPSPSSTRTQFSYCGEFCKSVTEIFHLNLPCYQSLAAHIPRLDAFLHATFELDKKLALAASFRVLHLPGQEALLFRWY